MATNPNLNYTPKPDRDPAPKLPVERGRGFPWAPVAIIVAALILAAIIYYLPRSPKPLPAATGAEVPQQPYISQLQLKSVKLVPAPVGSQVYVVGTVENTGTADVHDITVQGTFFDKNGTRIFTDTQPMVPISRDGNATTAGSFADSPLKANDGRSDFRIAFANIPATWNHQVPELRIVHVGTPNAPGVTQDVSPGTDNGSNAQGTVTTGNGQTSTSPAQGQKGNTTTAKKPQSASPNNGAQTPR
jgi:hypothetical protein